MSCEKETNPINDGDNVPQPSPNNNELKITFIDKYDNEFTKEGITIEYINQNFEDMLHISDEGCGTSIPNISKEIKYFKIQKIIK
jgi:hypothetical protein